MGACWTRCDGSDAVFLVIGYGNELRRDDGLGPRAARTVDSWGLSGVKVRTVHQLTPELSAEIAQCDEVIFIDADCGPDKGVRLRAVEPASSAAPSFHASSPASLLALVAAVWDLRPTASQVTIPGCDFDFGEGLSPEADVALAQALGEVRRKIEETTCTRSA